MRRLNGKTKIMYFEGDTALQVRVGSLVMLTDSATVGPARNDSTDDRILGVARRNDTTTDSSMVPVEVPVESMVEWEANTDTVGGAVDSDVGRFVTVDTEGGTTAGDSCSINVDVSDSSSATVAAPFFITRVLSGTRVVGVIAHTAGHHVHDTAV